jgi:hypothetical protein
MLHQPVLELLGGAIALDSNMREVFESYHYARSNNVHQVCPEALETLVPMLLRDLPSYANRVIQRSRSLDNGTIPSLGYVLVAGQPEYEPLTLGPGEYTSTTMGEGEPYQVFFTTLERQYLLREAVSIQHYHWLFLVKTERHWRVAFLFSRIGHHPANEPPSPPYDSGQGAIAQAIRLWLRDCAAGEI